MTTHNGSIEVIGLDWSGVISDDRRPVYEANMYLLREYKKPTITSEEFFRRSLASAQDFLLSRGVEEDPAVLFAKYKKYLEMLERAGISPKLIENADTVLQSLYNRGKRLAVVSTHPTENIQREACSYGIDRIIELILGSVESKAAALTQLVTQMKTQPKNVLYCGDMVHDIRSAKEAGVLSVAVATGYHSRKKLVAESPDFGVLRNLSDLLTIGI